MTALVIADLHLSAKSRDAYRFETMRTIPTLLRKHKVDELFVLGDLTEEKDYHSAQLVNAIVDMFHAFSELVDITVLTGNHDYTQIDCPFFHFLRRLQNIQWINAPKQMMTSVGDCLFLPHTRDYEGAWASVDLDHHNWIFAHNSFEGALSEHGKRLSGIPATVFPEGAAVISGDIHTPQVVGDCVTYVGSPYTVDFGDDFEPRALLLTRDKMRSIPLAGPQKRLVDLSLGFRPEDFDELEPGDIVKARYTLSPKEQDKWPDIRDRIKKELAERNVTVHLVQSVMTARGKHVEIKRAQTKSDTKLIEEYCKQSKVSDATLKVGLALAEED